MDTTASSASTSNGTTQYLDRPGGRIAFDVTGDGPLVVCIPGMGDLRSTYRHLVPALTKAGLRVATLDLRGHGDSDATFDRYDDVAAGQDALALVEHLGGPAVLVGNSMGAGAAAWAAAEQPTAVSGLVLVGPFVRDAPVSAVLRLAFRAAMAGPWRSSVWRSYLPTLYAGRRPDDFDVHRDAITVSLKRPGHSKAFGVTTHTSHRPSADRLDQVTAPTLVVMGTQDPDFKDPAAEAQWVGEQLHGQVLMVDEAGHYPQSQRPDVVSPAVVAFVQSVGA